jgi:3-dehydroquinate dehydratase-2
MAERKILVLSGPNLNLLGTREPEVYGSQTLADIGRLLEQRGAALGFTVESRQSNHEGALVDWLHEAQATGCHAVLLNAGAYTHTSIALLDAIRAIKVPVIEVHLCHVADGRHRLSAARPPAPRRSSRPATASRRARPC